MSDVVAANEPLYIEFPISNITIHPNSGRVDIIIFHTQLPDINGSPTLTMTVPKGRGLDYVQNTLEIPQELITVIEPGQVY